MIEKEALRRSFWVVSPNVDNNNLTVSHWRQASIKYKAAFMGYAPDDQKHKQIGYKFAHVVRANDILLIARRYKNKPEVVGFGVVAGAFKTKLKGSKVKCDSLRKLSLFKPLSAAPPNLPLMNALRQTTALRKLDPDKNPSHRLICEWMERRLGKKLSAHGRPVSKSQKWETRLTSLAQENELEYEVRTRRKVIVAKKKEAELVGGYREWLEDQQRYLLTVRYKNLRCDAYEKKRGNLIEAKCSARREYIRMAVGQLLDYAYLGKERFGKPNLAILLPKSPDQDSLDWLSELKISVVWKEKNVFLDNANGLFT
jgi:hypothetical protein